MLLLASALAAPETPTASDLPAAPATVASTAPPAEPTWQVLPDVRAALAVVLADSPRVLGVGELHATTGGPKVPSTMKVFTNEILPIVAPKTSDLILETWRLDGTCGAQEEQVATTVQTETKRPEQTKSDLVVLAETALALDVRPHDLAITCDEYATLLRPDGSVIYDTLLKLLTTKLGDFAEMGFATPDASLVIYGGAVHNDLVPKPEYAAWSYGPRAAEKGGTGYVELDLYQPELVTGAMVEPAWEPLLAKAGKKNVVLIQRAPRSWVLLLPKA